MSALVILPELKLVLCTLVCRTLQICSRTRISPFFLEGTL